MSREAQLGKNALPGPWGCFGILDSWPCIFTDSHLGTEFCTPRGSLNSPFLTHKGFHNLVVMSSEDLTTGAANTKCSHAIKSAQTWLRQAGPTFHTAPGILSVTPTHSVLHSFLPQRGSLLEPQAS